MRKVKKAGEKEKKKRNLSCVTKAMFFIFFPEPTNDAIIFFS